MDKQLTQSRKGNSKDTEREEERMKYKVGDKVRVRKDLEAGRLYGTNTFVEEMAEYSGKVVTIKYLLISGYNIGNSPYTWTDEMLEPATLSTGDMIDAIQPGQKYKNELNTVVMLKDNYLIVDSKCLLLLDGNLSMSAQWTLIPPEPKPVSFMDAVKAYAEGKTIRCKLKEDVTRFIAPKHKSAFSHFGYWIKGDGNTDISTGQILNGIWTVEDL
jgi:hypothetical protein